MKKNGFSLHGFTLIELMIGLMLSAMLGTVLFSVFFQSTRTLRAVDEHAEIDVGIAVVLNQFERDLAGVLVPEYEKEEKKEEEAVEKKADDKKPQATEEKKEKKKERKPSFIAKTKNKQLNFVTFVTTNPRSRHGSQLLVVTPKPSLVRVMYKLRENKEKKGTFSLLRQESTNLDVTTFEKKNEKRPRELVVCDTVQECFAQYLYRVEKEGAYEIKTADEWGVVQKEKVGSETEKDEEMVPLVPQMVRLTLTVWDSQLSLKRSIVYLMPIYAQFVESRQQEQKSTPTTEQQEKKPQAPGASAGTPPQSPSSTQQRPFAPPFQGIFGGGAAKQSNAGGYARRRGLASFFGGQ